MDSWLEGSYMYNTMQVVKISVEEITNTLCSRLWERYSLYQPKR